LKLLINNKLNLFNDKEIIKKKQISSLQKNKLIKKNIYIQRGTKEFTEVMLAFFSAGLATFTILYCVQSILPIFSKEFSISPAKSSLSLSISTLMMAIGMLFTGPLSDILGRKVIMTTSLLIAATLTILCATMNTWNNIIIIRGFTGLALSGVTAVAVSYLSEEIHPSALAFSIGLYISGNTIGGFSGRFISSFLTTYFSWNFSLMIIGFFSLISAISFLYFLPSSKNFKTYSTTPKNFFGNLLSQCQDKTLLVLFAIGFILMGCFITLFNYVSYRFMLTPFFFNQISIGFLSAIYLVGVYTSPKAGILIENYGRKFILISALVLMILGVIITQWNILFLILLGLILFSAGFFAAHSVASSWISCYVKIAKGQASSLYLFFYYLGSSIFGTFGGYFWVLFGWMGISLFIVIMIFIGIILANQLTQ